MNTIFCPETQSLLAGSSELIWPPDYGEAFRKAENLGDLCSSFQCEDITSAFLVFSRDVERSEILIYINT